jgi:hypothetical protein
MNYISVFRWRGCEEISVLLGSLVKLLSYRGMTLAFGAREQEFIYILST